MGIASMTGFGSGSATEAGEQIAVELKTVNGKFCEVKARLPRELASLEIDLVKQIKARLARGNVDASVRRTSTEALQVVPKINAPLIAAYAGSLKRAAEEAGLSSDLSLKDLLGLEGVVSLEERSADLAASTKALTAATELALSGLLAVRQREGAALAADLRARTAHIREIIAELSKRAPATVAAFRDRLRARIQEIAAGAPVDPGRLEQEVILFAERSDVAEELTRLTAHIDELDRLLTESVPVGRQLDFLIQEINREANTTGSKSQSTDLAKLVVELKTEIERMREQVQNVE
jgi:uncharacterized protein (TIGR00255 family)